MARETHYGLKIGDKVVYDESVDPNATVTEGEVIHLYATDNNKCKLKLEDGTCLDAVCEWCRKINDVSENDLDHVIQKIIHMEIPARLEKTAETLYEICDNEHASCNSNCPVYFVNGNDVPLVIESCSNGTFSTNCRCFKNGREMIEFIKESAI